jgi:hypothetical protein
MVGAGIPRPQAEAASRTGARYGDVLETPSIAATKRGQDISAATARRGQDLAEGRAAAGAAARATSTTAATSEQTPLPSILAAADRLEALTPDDIKKMSAAGVAMVNTVQQQGGYTGIGVDLLGKKTGQVSDIEREYVELTGAIADAVARQSEVGVLTNQDINRYRNQIIFKSGDSEADKVRKVERAVGWARWLNSRAGGDQQASGQSPQERFDQRVQRGMDSTGAASLVDRETQAAQPAAGAPSLEVEARAWRNANPPQPGETPEAYARRFQQRQRP